MIRFQREMDQYIFAQGDCLMTNAMNALVIAVSVFSPSCRNNDLESIIKKTPRSRLADLVFMQNGMLTPYLESKDLAENTQALVYFAVPKKGETPVDGKTDLNPEGLTAVTGKWAEDFSVRMKQGGLSCHVLPKNEWTVAMVEKHIWICAFMAVGAKHGGCTVGQVEADHKEEVNNLIVEMAAAASKVLFASLLPMKKLLTDYCPWSIVHCNNTNDHWL